MTLTTTQHSALGDLHRFGELVVDRGNAQRSRGTRFGYGAATLQALVDAGHAEWVTTSADSTYPAWPRTVVAPGGNAERHAATARRQRVVEATAYVTSRFYPPLPQAYGELAVKALEVWHEEGEPGDVALPEDLNPMPRQARLVTDPETGREVPVVNCLALIDALRIGHMLDDFEWEA